jgi:hypothetical protein
MQSANPKPILNTSLPAQRGERMLTCFKALSLFAVIFALAFLAHKAIVPNVVAIADGEQSNWQVQLAFVLVSLENIGLGGAALVLMALVLDRWQEVRRDKNAR